MNATITFKILSGLALILIVSSCNSCKKNNPSPDSNSFNVVTTDKWKLVGQDTFIWGGNAGGGLNYFAFDFQNDNELRYSYEWGTNNFSHHGMEMIINNKDEVKLESIGQFGQFMPPILQIKKGENKWTLIEDFPNKEYTIYRNSITTEASIGDYYYNATVVDRCNEGFFGMEEYSKKRVFYNINTGITHKGGVNGRATFPVYYNNSIYDITLFEDPLWGGVSINKLNGSSYEKIKFFNDTTLNREVLRTRLIGNEAFAVAYYMDTAAHTENYIVYKFNLQNLTCKVMQRAKQLIPYGHYGKICPNGKSQIDVDEQGNMYVIEMKSENGKGRYFIRKYNVNGTTEVILDGDRDLSKAQINGIKLFNGSLYAAISTSRETSVELMKEYFIGVIKMN